ncbi:MAG: cation:proton antiporter [Sandaracinaceae bacterium]|nr:cation:proton antiporter [Sandaracinaceae bacterium]
MRSLHPVLPAALVGATSLAWPAAARADGGSTGADSTLTVVALVGAVSVAYLLAHFVVGRLQKAFLVLAGVEYVLLGALLADHGHMPYRLPAFSDLRDVLPIVALAVGWVGLLRGVALRVARLREGETAGPARVVVVQALAAGGLTTAAAYAAIDAGWFGETGAREAWMAAGGLGCAAAAGSTGPIELLSKRYRLEGPLPERIRRMAVMSDLLAIVVFGLLFAVHHSYDANAAVQPSATEWAVVSVLLGVLLGVLFRPFLGEDDSENGRLLALVGIIVLSSGASYFLQLSPLFVNLTLGLVLVNTAKAGPQIRATLKRTRAPMALVLLVFAGALWRPPALDAAEVALFAIGYTALRIAGKWLGTGLAAWRAGLRPDYYRGLLAHGEVSVAMAVSLRLVYEGPAIDLAYTAILASVIVCDLVAPRVLRGLLVDTGDLRGEKEPA